MRRKKATTFSDILLSPRLRKHSLFLLVHSLWDTSGGLVDLGPDELFLLVCQVRLRSVYLVFKLSEDVLHGVVSDHEELPLSVNRGRVLELQVFLYLERDLAFVFPGDVA